jgi:hypothetical protein
VNLRDIRGYDFNGHGRSEPSPPVFM